MWLLTVLSNVLCCICQPLGEEALTSLRGAAQELFSFLRGWVVGEFNARRNAVVEVPVDSALIIGAEETLREILNHLRDDGVDVIGIWGMGGIGKTTLLRKINNHLFESKASWGNFNVVIWVTVSQEVSIPMIQKLIGDRLNLSFTDSQSTVEDRANLLFQALSQKRFLLLLDDLWEKLDLVKVGIPRNHRDCKVAFTTRSSQVCSNMDAAKIVDVKLLDETQSWKLFCSKFTTEAALQNPSIQPLARQVVRKCGGLPLALITVGRAMANRKLPGEWRNAIKELDHPPKYLQGMDEVISRLKFSYDYLENDKMRSALLSCAMYREDEDIFRKRLIDLWIGEGLLDVEDGADDVDEHIDDVRDRGDVLISNLQHACLLEPGIKHEDRYVRLHDAVRDMALWINNHGVGNVDGFCVLDRRDSTQVTKMQSRGDLIRRIWVRNSDLEGFPHDLTFPNICTLRVNFYQPHKVIKPSLLQGFLISSMRTLRVLNLSGTRLTVLPVEIGLLLELRYLNLSSNYRLKSLPKELGGLVRLRHLELENTGLDRVPREAIAGLSSLQVLNLYNTHLDWDTGVEMKDSGRCEGSQQHSNLADMEDSDEDSDEGSQQHSNLADDVGGEGGRQLQLNDLQGLGRLQELHISLRTSQSLLRVLSSDKLCRCTRRLHLAWSRIFDKIQELRLEDMDHPWVGPVGVLRFDLNVLPCLEQLELWGISGELTITIVGRNGGVTPTFSGPSLKVFYIYNSEGLKELKFVGRFPSLEEIRLFSCYQMEEVTLDDDDGVGTGRGERQGLLDSHFPMLTEMRLWHLPALRSIGRQPLLFPSLQTINLVRCPMLRRLPLGPSSAPKLGEISCDQKLWDAIEWGSSDGHDIKLIFEPFLVPDDDGDLDND